MNVENTHKIIGIGHAMCDISVELAPGDLESLGERFQARGATAPLHVRGDVARDILAYIEAHAQAQGSVTLDAGGSALNALRVASWLGSDCAMYGTLGADSFGDEVRRGLSGAGVTDRLITLKDPGSATGIFCTIRGAETSSAPLLERKMVFASPESARKIREIDVEALDLANARYFHTEGLLADSPAFFERLLGRCGEEGVAVSIDLVSAEFVRRNRETLVPALQNSIDCIFCTRREFEALGVDPRSPKGDTLWIIKADREGVDCFAGGRRYHSDAPRCAVVDDTGAGDAFAGAFLAARIAGRSVPRCLELATSAAACALTSRGPAPDRHCLHALRRDFLAD